MPSAQHLLVVIAPGVGYDDAAHPEFQQMTRSLQGGAIQALHRCAGSGRGQELGADSFARTVRGLGLSLDRRSIALRPPWRSDAAVLRQLEQRPAGPADVTLLELRGVRQSAAQHGIASRAHQRALAQLAHDITRARRVLIHRGLEPRTCVLGLGGMEPVGYWFDPLRHLPRRLRRRSRVTLAPEALTIECASWHDATTLDALLDRDPFTRHGRAIAGATPAASGLPAPSTTRTYVPRRGTAFAPVAALLPLLPDDASGHGIALVPWPTRSPGPAAIGHVAVRVLSWCSELAALRPDLQPAADSFPDLRELLEHHTIGIESMHDAGAAATLPLR